MTIRTILVPVRGDGKGEGVLDHAISLAGRLGAHLEVLHSRPRPEDMLPFGVPVSASMKKTILEQAAATAVQEEEHMRALFDDYCKRHKLAVVDGPPGPKKGVSASWHGETGKQSETIALVGRLADIIVIAQPDDDGVGAKTLEAALLETGKMVLVVPPAPAMTIGAHIAVGWNGGTEAAKAVTAGLALLEAADTVTMFSAPVSTEGRLPVDRLDRYLRWHGIEASLETLDVKATEVGAALLDGAAKAGADVLLMGGFGESRRRVMVMGSVTRHVIEHAGMPVILAH